MNEVRITTNYSFSNLGASFAGANTYTYSISGVNAIADVQTIASGGVVALITGNCSDLRHVYLKNQNSTTGNAALSLNSSMTQVFSLLRPSESIVLSMPASTTGVWVSGQFAAIDIQVCANES